MSKRLTVPKPKRRSAREKRRAAAKQMASGTVDITKTIPAPPEPSWCHWWDPKKRLWMSHDPRVVAYIRVLATCPDPDYLANLTEMVLNAPDLVETGKPE